MKREITFASTFEGQLHLEDGSTISIGREAGMAQPYDLLFGALASCLYATFLSILEKKRITIGGCRIVVDGEKRTDPPTTLKTVHLSVTVTGSERKEAVEKSFALATKYCSVYQTISQVAKMSWELNFE